MNFWRLLRYEWKKSFGRALLWGIVLLLGILDLANIYDQYCKNSYFADGDGWRRAYWELYDDFAGEITDDKLAQLQALYLPLKEKIADRTFNTAIDPDSLTGVNEFSDYLLLDNYYVAYMERFGGYAETAEEIARIARENVERYNAVGNTYQARVNVKIYRLFHGRQITEFAYLEGYMRLTEYSLSAWLALMVCMLAASGVFAGEKGVQMHTFLKTMANGYHATVSAKLLAALLFAALVSLWFSAVDYCGFACVYGFADAGSLPVYALPDFTDSALNCTILQYVCLAAVSRALGAAFFTLLCCLLSLLFATPLAPFLLGCAMSGGACLLARQTENAYHALWRACNPAFLLDGGALYQKTEYLNLLGEPIAVPLAAVVWCLLAGGGLIGAIHFMDCREGLT